MKAYLYGLAGFESVENVLEDKKVIFLPVNGSTQVFVNVEGEKVPDKHTVQKLRFEHVGYIRSYKFIGIE